MDDIIEFVLELFLDLGYEASKSKRVPKYIRYPLIALLLLVYCGFIGFLMVQGFLLLSDNLLSGLMIIGIGLLLAIGIWIAIRKARKKINESKNEP